MLKLKPKYLSKNGRREFVVLTVEEFERVIDALEDAGLARAMREAQIRNANSPKDTLEEVKRRPKVSSARPKKTR